MRRKAGKLMARFVNNRRSIIRDLGLAISHLGTFPYIILPLNADDSVKSELQLSSYNTIFDMMNVGAQVVFPSVRKPGSEGTMACIPPNYKYTHTHSKWYFINGIATSPPLAMLNGQELAWIFNRPIHLLHTPTYSALWDLWDSITARTLRKDGKLSRPAYNVIRNALETHDKVVLVAHSQGTIVSSYIVRKLLKQKETRHLAHKLEIYCFAGVADSLHVDEELTRKHGRPVPYVEHFANSMDYFARIGILAHLESTAGPVYVAHGKKGHLLNDHYIGGIGRGEYCEGESRLYTYVNGSSPDEDHYVHSRHWEVTYYDKNRKRLGT